MRSILASILLSLCLASAASADAIEDTFAAAVKSGTYEAAVASLAKDSNPKAQAAAGVLQFGTAIERLGQGLYRHGLQSPQRGAMMMLLPVLRMPVPVNPSPEKIDYAKFRAILETLVQDLDAAEISLAKLADAEAKLPLDFAAIGFDFNADGKRGPDESLANLLAAMGQAGTPGQTSLLLNFDTADIYWLRGYGRFVSSFAQFMLAHDFEAQFNSTFHVFFPKSGLPVGDLLAANTPQAPGALTGMNDEGTIGDAIAFIHLLNWPVTDAARLEDVRARLVAMAGLSPQSWAAARKETDNDREWLPNAKQTQAITGSTNTDEVIDGWLAVMTEFKAILDGQKLLPHWRFAKGINVKRMFAEQKRFDMVLLITGTDAVRYLEDGPISDSARWNDLMRAFRGNFLGYAVWFN